jgi:hypothetical protein
MLGSDEPEGAAAARGRRQTSGWEWKALCVQHTSTRHMRHTVILHHPHCTRIGPHATAIAIARLASAAIG